MPKPIQLAALILIILLPSIGRPQTDPGSAHAEVIEMQQVEDAWSTAVTRRDQYGLENVLSPRLVDIAATGDVTTRNQDVAKLFVKDALPASLKQTVVDVRTVAEGVKVVNGTYSMHWLQPAGSSSGTLAFVDEKGIFTHVFQQVSGRWVCVNSQRTVVAEQTPQTKSKAAAPRTKSNAAEPFHIPLIYKGAQSNQPTPPPAAQTPQP